MNPCLGKGERDWWKRGRRGSRKDSAAPGFLALLILAAGTKRE